MHFLEQLLCFLSFPLTYISFIFSIYIVLLIWFFYSFFLISFSYPLFVFVQPIKNIGSHGLYSFEDCFLHICISQTAVIFCNHNSIYFFTVLFFPILAYSPAPTTLSLTIYNLTYICKSTGTSAENKQLCSMNIWEYSCVFCRVCSFVINCIITTLALHIPIIGIRIRIRDLEIFPVNSWGLQTENVALNHCLR